MSTARRSLVDLRETCTWRATPASRSPLSVLVVTSALVSCRGREAPGPDTALPDTAGTPATSGTGPVSQVGGFAGASSAAGGEGGGAGVLAHSRCPFANFTISP